ncbi:mortality factor 4-like protein 1 [Dromiciops gliroides]|uniref:mortality factor 4-like protein 1 n=1 Tax=Dromiciops gliroides TaxID=33562 RepID=UPI001CC446BB|nr:mortality factor 4-like protein 1 [Dromiciops gliroides]
MAQCEVLDGVSGGGVYSKLQAYWLDLSEDDPLGECEVGEGRQGPGRLSGGWWEQFGSRSGKAVPDPEKQGSAGRGDPDRDRGRDRSCCPCAEFLMSPKASRKTQPPAGGPEVQAPEDPAQVGNSELQIQPQAGAPDSPAPPQPQASPGDFQALSQPQGGGIPEMEPQPSTSSDSQPQPESSSGFQPQLQAGLSGALFPAQPESSGELFSPQPSTSSGFPPQPGPAAAQTLGPLEVEAGAQQPPFQAGDQVLCLHGSLLYEAKCMRVAEAACGTAAEAEAGSLTYLIHYTGWNKNWDEWVPASRVFEYSEANLARQSELLRAHQAQRPLGKKGRGGLRARKTPGLQQRAAGRAGPSQEALGAGEGAGPSEMPQPGAATRRKRVRAEAGAESRAAPAGIRADVKVEIPEELKPWLVDDWDLVTKQNQLFYLPARKNVDSILEDYAQARTAPGTAEEKAFAVVEVVAGIKEYFNVMLGTQLLYKFERPQYAEILAQHPDVPMSQIYGAPHLLRLFVRIGAMLAYTPLDDHSLALLLGHLHDFVGYLAENCAALFNVSDYGVAPPEYHERAES